MELASDAQDFDVVERLDGALLRAHQLNLRVAQLADADLRLLGTQRETLKGICAVLPEMIEMMTAIRAEHTDESVDLSKYDQKAG